MDKLLYIHRVAKILDCSRPYVYKLIYEGKIKAVRLGKRGYRISKESVNQFILDNTINPETFAINDNPGELKNGDTIIINEDSVDYNELAGDELMVVKVVAKGVYAKEWNERGSGVFIPFEEFSIADDFDCELHGL
jgi:excisionase family DNA binding protein